MARYEVAVETSISFHTGRTSFGERGWPDPETVAIAFEGRRFVWHVVDPTDGVERWPTVTTVVAIHDDYRAERHATERFLSAIAYLYWRPVNVVGAAGAGFPAEFDPPVRTANRRGLGDNLVEAAAEIVVVNDPRLQRVLGYFRDGLGTTSPFFRYLAFWNALEIACDDDSTGGIKSWIGPAMVAHPELRGANAEPPPADWWSYLWMEQRGAVAHAVRDPTYPPEIDPDDPDTQARFWRDSRVLSELVRIRVRERWGDDAVSWRRLATA